VRRTLPAGQTRDLDTIPDHSLSLLLVDVSRAWQAVPWSRLRAKLLPGAGRLVVFTPWTDASLDHADLLLPTAAPLEAEEFAGGDDRHPELRLSLTRVLEPPEHELVDPLRIARDLDPGAPDPVEHTARMLVARSGAQLFDPERGKSGAAPASAEALVRELRKGHEWRGETVTSLAAPQARRVSLTGFASSPATARDRIHLRIEGPVFAGAGIPLPPVLAKLSSESRLITGAGGVRAHPRTLARLGIRDGATHTLRTSRGEYRGRLVADDSVEHDGFVVMTGFDPAGFSPDGVRGADPLGHVDVDPRSDHPQEWVLEEVV
jgi:hypothetical protein